MSRFRLLPTPGQEQALLGHCRDARYVWNLAVEQQRHWQPAAGPPVLSSNAHS
ncbi:helix-turn-helix domain-containing protein [Mycolicibacterium tusciae]|uniref:helix-turn-helix domain-containing protein n=1 Tax=Mycolicibacterium tusciae TaxID=75922 RepID=UPI003B3A7C3E